MFYMNIDEGNLRDLLHQRKRYIKSYGDAVAAGIALGAYVMTILLSNIKDSSLTVKILAAAMAAIYLFLFIKAIYNSKYSVEALLADIMSCSNEHNFSLLLFEDSQGRFLLKKDPRWKTWLFPYVRTKENDAEAIKDYAQKNFGVSVQITKTEESDFTKHSVSANMTKTYHHIFYKLSFDEKAFPQKDKFKINGAVYKWFSFDQMKADKDLMLKNRDNVSFVESKF